MNYNGFPATYNPMNYQPVQQTPVPNFNQQQNNGNSILWVQGEAGAKAYPVAPGNSLLLMDSEARQFYIKSTDQSGMPQPLRIFSYEEIHEAQTIQKQNIDYVTREEFEKRIAELTTKPVRAKKEAKDDE